MRSLACALGAAALLAGCGGSSPGTSEDRAAELPGAPSSRAGSAGSFGFGARNGGADEGGAGGARPNNGGPDGGRSAAGGSAAGGASAAGADGAGAAGGEPVVVTAPTPEELALLVGDDALGDALEAGYLDFEADPLEIARAVGASPDCASPNVHVAEEPHTRFRGMSRITTEPVPRAVLSQCSDAPENVFIVLTSPQTAAGSSDPLAATRTTELMALDRGTGLYNFYVVERDAVGFTLRRVLETPNGDVVERSKAPGGALTERIDTEGACLYCHANGAPMLLEVASPRGPWLADASESRHAYTGLSGQLLAKTSPAAELEKVVSAGLERHLRGSAGALGHVARVLAGELAGGSARLLRSVFCPTEYQLLSPASGQVPTDLFEDAFLHGGTVNATLASSDLDLLYVPVRAEADRAIEAALIESGVLSLRTVQAARLWDPTASLSRGRCELFAKLVPGMPEQASKVDDHVRAVLAAEWTAREPSPERSLALRLLDPADDPSAELTAYLAGLRSELPDRIANASAEAVEERIRARVGWMIERFIPPFALNPVVYAMWL